MPCGAGADRAQRPALRSARHRLRLSQLRHPLPGERGHRTGRVARRRADPGARTARRRGADAPPPARGAGRRRRRFATPDLCRGPGNLTRALGISLKHNTRDLTRVALRIEDRGLPARDVVWGRASGSTSAWNITGAVRPPAVRGVRYSEIGTRASRRRSLACSSRAQTLRPRARRLLDRTLTGRLAAVADHRQRRGAADLGVGEQPDELRRVFDRRAVEADDDVVLAQAGAVGVRRAVSMPRRATPRAFGAPELARRSARVIGCSWMPRIVPRRTPPYLMMSSITCRARLLGTANPMP